MNKIVKGNRMNMHVGVDKEHLYDYIDIFSPYFKSACHHFQDYHTTKQDMILFYSYFPNEIDCEGCNNVPNNLIVTKKSPDKFGDCFFECKRMDQPCARVEIIYYDSKLVGFYCRKNNLLSLSDMVHQKGNQKHLKTILDEMLKHGFISILEKNKEKTSITLGTDPEMESIIKGVTVPATRLMQLSNNEKVYLSHDGHTQPQRELRPDPSSSPEELVENIRDLIKISSFFGENLSVLGKYYPLGGHIHIGNATPSKELVLVLDYFLGPFEEFNSIERRKSKYGKPGDVRVKPHGFEYRTPPPAWLLTPTLALRTLQLTKIVVENIINNIDVVISDDMNYEEYKKNIQLLGFTKEWAEEFENEIRWARNHLFEPLAKTWGVEIPKEYQIKKEYITTPILPRAPSIGRTRLNNIRSSSPLFDNQEEMEGSQE